MTSRYLAPLAVLATMLMTAPLTAAESEQVILGYTMVTRYCQDCHAIGITGESRFAPAPPFRELHKRYDVELLTEALVEGLVTAHPAMPEFEFDPNQAEAIISYLKTLAPIDLTAK